MLVSSFQNIRDNVKESEWIEITIKKKILEFIKKMVKNGMIENEHLPKDLSRLSDNVYSLLKETSKSGKIYKIHTVKIILEEIETFLESEKIPKSISLQQYLFIFLVKNNKIKRENSEYSFLVTEEVEDIYPKLINNFECIKKVLI